jgi:hypothetical protein
MPDDLTKRAPQDKRFISLKEEHEVRYWTKELGVSVDQLKVLVAQNGNSADAIRAALGK